MKVTRNVILDLLPLYIADEVSTDSRILVEEYLETDPSLAKITSQSVSNDILGEIPVPLTKEKEMETYKEAKRLLTVRTLGIAVMISFVLLCVLGFAGFVWLGALRVMF